MIWARQSLALTTTIFKIMSLINYSDVTGHILNGANRDTVNLHNGYYLREAVGYAKITSTLQTNIPIYLPSQAQAGGELVTNPDKLLILPTGSIVTRIALRLPATETSKTTQYGNLPVGRTLVGTTGELVKVGATGVFTTTAPSIAAASSVYTANASATVQRPVGTTDVTASGLITTGAATTYSLLVSNAGSTAAGSGIATSAAGVEALAIVQICWYEVQPAPSYELLGYQSAQKRG
ncbi:MAG: hypothetical protein ACEQSC_00655 [Candidatus Nanopelagicaceae bacterium]